MSLSKKVNHSDIWGAAASGLCAIHCAITPLFFASRPVLEGSALGQSGGQCAWSGFDYIFLVISFFAVWYSVKYTSRAAIKWILWVSWLVFAAGLLTEILHFPFAKWLMYSGSVALVITHIFNHLYCQKCKVGECT